MDTFNSPLLGNSRLCLDSPVSTLAMDMTSLSCRLTRTPKRLAADVSSLRVRSKRLKTMVSSEVDLKFEKTLKWESDDENDSGFASLESTSSALDFDSEDDVASHDDVTPSPPKGFSNLLRAPLRELPSNFTEHRSPLKLARRSRSRLQTTSEKRRAAADIKATSLSNNKNKVETPNQSSIKAALSRGDVCEDLIADFTTNYSLPRCQSKHSDMQGISPDTLSKLLDGDFSSEIDTFTIVDCRYPYEYDGGCIQGAENVYTKTDICDRFMKTNEFDSGSDKKNIIIFHCEFSSERGPKMCRYLRECDRKENAHQYPKLKYPEMYLLEGGYKAFFEHNTEQCSPQTYKPMLHADHSQDLKLFRAKTKSMNGSKVNRRRLLLR